MDSRVIHLRQVLEADLAVFFEQQRDEEARYMAAFTSKDGDDRLGFMSHWGRILNDDSVIMRAVVLEDGRVAGSIGSYVDADRGAPEVTYWIGKDHWGNGIASQALALFLELQVERPIYARLAKDNSRSLKVLTRHDFELVGEDVGFAPARGVEVEEIVMVLGEPKVG